MNVGIFASLALLVALLPTQLSAASFSVLCDSEAERISRACTIKLTGPIVSGDAERLRQTLRNQLPDGWHYHALLLDSPGGSVAVAIELAGVVRQAVLNTTTYRIPKNTTEKIRNNERIQFNWKCISACFLVWVAGAERSFMWRTYSPDRTSDIGLHRPYLDKATYTRPPEEVAGIQQEVMRVTADYLQREQVPQALIEKMLSRASTQIYWLTEEDDALSGRAPWFEEMMIARCNYDPVYHRETEAWVVKEVERQVRRGKKPPEDPATALGPRWSKYLEWRRRYNACEYSIRRSAQTSLR